MTLHVHRAERADLLVGALAELLANPLDPFVSEVVAVPTKGVERWLAQSLSHRLGAGAELADGVCAAVQFRPPSRLVADAVSTATELDPDTDPWRSGALLWSVLAELDELAGTPTGHEAMLTHYVREGPGRRLGLARRISELFEAYAANRPELIVGWAQGRDGELPDGCGWQPLLWRAVRQRLGTDGPAERLATACARIAADASVLQLPGRLSVFGPTRLSRAELLVLTAMAGPRDVHLWLPHPSPAMWQAVGDIDPIPRRRAADRSGESVRHRLLGSLSRDSRELQLLLRDVAGSFDDHQVVGPPRPVTVLGELQRRLTGDLAPSRPVVLAAGDRSLEFHACHGPDRQVEVLRELILGTLSDDLSLEPRDIVVLCSDIERYAPLLAAAFGTAPDGEETDGHPGHRLSIRLADRSLRSTNPVLAALAELLTLADSRMSASAGLDLLGAPAVRTRFGLSDEDLERLGELVAEAGVQWGLDAAHRAEHGLPSYAGNTWASGLDRMLLGVAMSEDGQWFVDTAFPLDGVESSEVDRIGRLAEFVDRLARVLTGLRGSRPLSDWITTLRDAVATLTATGSGSGWQQTQALGLLDEVLADAGPQQRLEIELADLRALLGARLRGRPTRANFRTGSLTACTMLPMRAVPHRVVCLLGLDDGSFPRRLRSSGDDLLAVDPQIGDRDPRSEDRQLLLDAVLAATEKLVVVYAGADPRTNEIRPPAVPIGELRDAVDEAVVTEAGEPASSRLVVRHPLQPFDPVNFDGRGKRPFSFDHAALRGARALGQQREPAPFLEGPLPDVPAPTIELPALQAFYDFPARAFLKLRLGIRLVEDADRCDDRVTIERTGLAAWQVGDRQLSLALRGVDADRRRRAELLRGDLPAGRFGADLLDEVFPCVEAITQVAQPLLTPGRRGVDIDVPVPGGSLTATVGVYGDNVLTVSYSSPSVRYRFRAWLQLLALTVMRPDVAWQAVLICRSGKDAKRVRLGPVPASNARRFLDELVEIFRRGRTGPIPLFPAASYAYAERRPVRSRSLAWRFAQQAWEQDFKYGAEHYTRLFGPGVTLATAIGDDPTGERVEQPADDDDDDEASDFGRLARAVYRPMLEHSR